MSDDESTVDNKTVSGNDVNEDTNVNKEIKEAKSIPKKEKKETQSITEDNSNSTSEIKLNDNVTFGNEGLELSTESHTLEVLCDFILKHEVDICGMTETNTHWKHPKGKKDTVDDTSILEKGLDRNF